MSDCETSVLVLKNEYGVYNRVLNATFDRAEKRMYKPFETACYEWKARAISVNSLVLTEIVDIQGEELSVIQVGRIEVYIKAAL